MAPRSAEAECRPHRSLSPTPSHRDLACVPIRPLRAGPGAAPPDEDASKNCLAISPSGNSWLGRVQNSGRVRAGGDYWTPGEVAAVGSLEQATAKSLLPEARRRAARRGSTGPSSPGAPQPQPPSPPSPPAPPAPQPQTYTFETGCPPRFPLRFQWSSVGLWSAAAPEHLHTLDPGSKKG